MSTALSALVLTTNFRNADNWLELFQRIVAEGGRCELLSLPWRGDPSAPRFAELEAVLPTRARRDIHELSPAGIAPDELRTLLEAACRDVDVLFLCDVQSYPSTAVHAALAQLPRRPTIIGLQHGLYQSWWLYNQHFCVDYLFVLGERHRLELAAPLRARAVAVGLPKLDRLQSVATDSQPYIGYLAQKIPAAGAVAGTLDELQSRTGLAVVVRDHPQYPAYPAAAGDGAAAPAPDYLRFLASAGWLVTPHSTAGIEGLYLGKTVVLVPNAGLTAWAGYPGIAWDLNAGEVLAAKQRAEHYPAAIAKFLDDVVGGLRFDHAERAWQALLGIVGRPQTAMSTAPPPAAPATDLASSLEGLETRLVEHIDDLIGPIGPDRRRRNYNRRILFELLSRVELGIGDLLLSNRQLQTEAPGIRVLTEHPIAAGSLDHRQPLGSAQDNTRGLGFCMACEQLFGHPVRLLDLGCAGGGVVYDFLLRGHLAVGIEGSDYSRNMGRAAWRIFPHHLFTADITQPFSVVAADGQPMQFDVVSCWEVLEHIAEADLPVYFDNVARHLRPGGIFVGTVAFSHSPYHQTVQPKPWWMAQLAQRFDAVEPLPFRKEQLTRGVAAGLFDSADYFEDPQRGWHFCYRARG